LFKEPDLASVDEIHLEWKEPDEEGLLEFLVNQKGFNSDRVKSGVKKIKASKSKSTQKRLADFFGTAPSSSSSSQPGNPPPAKKAKTAASSSKKAPGAGAKKKK
jgi:flap endonuclease-1